MKANRWISLYPLSSKDRKAVTPPFSGTTEKGNMKMSMLLLELDGKGVRIWKVLLLFQAEDGIRDYYASRGLGDVYKRQD